ncbi:hypothetical protein GCM10019016_080640 [Streptomyces prasinosporus]|uniref:Uncharacterized protein n=1 Tax=Streptomyces prasinosporus TaxID=68256 RepID=A0ABP6U0J4_9ACTN|nr:hypothetical protein GCM10010332_50860 [Streptomyces albogriseolus]
MGAGHGIRTTAGESAPLEEADCRVIGVPRAPQCGHGATGRPGRPGRRRVGKDTTRAAVAEVAVHRILLATHLLPDAVRDTRRQWHSHGRNKTMRKGMKAL